MENNFILLLASPPTTTAEFDVQLEVRIFAGQQPALLSYTAHQFKKILKAADPVELERYRVDLADRTYQFWERNPLSVAIFHDEVYYQKMQYVHWNPCTERWRLAAKPEGYKYSSAYQVEEKPFWDFVAGE